MKKGILAGLLALGLTVTAIPAQAGLDLENQQEIRIDWLDLNRDKRITRAEVGEYLFFYFDRDGNESLSRSEYNRDQELTVIPYEGDFITYVDIDNDNVNDGTEFTTESFLVKAMIGTYDPEKGTIEAQDVIDKGWLRADSDRSGYIELDEWQDIYERAAVMKKNKSPAFASEDRYQD